VGVESRRAVPALRSLARRSPDDSGARRGTATRGALCGLDRARMGWLHAVMWHRWRGCTARAPPRWRGPGAGKFV